MYGRTVFPLCFMLALICIGATPDRAPAGQTEAAASETFGDKFLPYEPIYAVVGVDGLDTAKFQLSFKYRFVDHLYLGYSQTTVWDLDDPSAPFRDTSHRPTLFYHFKERGPNNPGRRSWLGVAVGGEHESNGKAGADSRSLNTVYLRPVFTVEDPGKSRLRIIPEIVYFTSVSGGNQDIAEYRGHVDLLVIYDMEKGFGWLDGLQIAGFFSEGDGGKSLDHPDRHIVAYRFAGTCVRPVFQGLGRDTPELQRAERYPLSDRPYALEMVAPENPSTSLLPGFKASTFCCNAVVSFLR